MDGEAEEMDVAPADNNVVVKTEPLEQESSPDLNGCTDDTVSEVKKKDQKSQWCSAINCTSGRYNSPGLSFFRFPRDAQRCKQWVINSRREDLLNKSAKSLFQSNVLCALHFESSQFTTPKKNRLKARQAVPTIFDVPNPPARLLPKRKPPKEREVITQSTSEPEIRHPPPLSALLPQPFASVGSDQERIKNFKKKIDAQRKRIHRLNAKLTTKSLLRKNAKQEVETIKSLSTKYLPPESHEFLCEQLDLSLFYKSWKTKNKSQRLSINQALPTSDTCTSLQSSFQNTCAEDVKWSLPSYYPVCMPIAGPENTQMATLALIQHATDALQAQERLSWMIGQDKQWNEEVTEKVHNCNDSLRRQKSVLEGSDADFKNPDVNEESMIELKQLTLMHVPSSVTKEAAEKFRLMVEQHMKDQCESVVSITLLTCPWYELSQRERGEQAKHNILLVIFMSYDSQFFTPSNPQVREKASVIDFGWFCAIEMSHFGQALVRGRTRYLEALYCRDGAEIYASPEWQQLRQALSYPTVTGTRGFAEACLGQAVGGVGKKRPFGGMRLREGATIYEICESFRLLQHAENALRLKANHSEVDTEKLPPLAVDAVAKIKFFYDSQEPVRYKQELFELLMKWSTELRALFADIKADAAKTSQAETDTVIGKWLMETRLRGRTLTPMSALPDSHSRLMELLQEVGGPVSQMQPENILLVAVAGSAMYNLNVPSSDVDYLVVYATPTETLMSTTKKLPETHESRGLDKTVEYGAYEARTFCEMLLKCSVVILELLFSTDHHYMSSHWQELAKHKRSFVTEKAISQYLGLIRNNFKTIERGKLSDSVKRDRKLFYQNFHKIHSLQYMMGGEVPPVRVDGEIREFIMNVRTQEDGEWSRENILTELEKQYRELREKLAKRTFRLGENPDYNLCTRWLLSVRGL